MRNIFRKRKRVSPAAIHKPKPGSDYCGLPLPVGHHYWGGFRELRAGVPEEQAISRWIFSTSVGRQQLALIDSDSRRVVFFERAFHSGSEPEENLLSCTVAADLMQGICKQHEEFLGPKLSVSFEEEQEHSWTRLGGTCFLVGEGDPDIAGVGRNIVWSSLYLMRDEAICEARHRDMHDFTTFLEYLGRMSA